MRLAWPKIVTLVGVVALAGCGSPDAVAHNVAAAPRAHVRPPEDWKESRDAPAEAAGAEPRERGGPGIEAPPALAVSSEAGSSHRQAYTYCWISADQGVCADGGPSNDNRIDVRGELRTAFPVAGWALRAHLSNTLDEGNGRRLGLVRAGTGRWAVAEPLPKGRHVLFIDGWGPEGDAYWAVPLNVVGRAPAADH